MGSQLKIGDIAVEVVRKDIKHAYLRVHPPEGQVRISAPRRMNDAALLAFANSRLGWIRQQQAKIRSRVPVALPRYVEGESLDLWGRTVLLRVSERAGPPSVELESGQLHLKVGPGTDLQQREAVVEAWYRQQLMAAFPSLLARWEPVIDVKAKKVTLRRMKTRWGSCSKQARTIRINTELAKKPPECLEYVIVHELAHLLEPSHNTRFKKLMDRFLPGWRSTRKVLNDPGLGHPNWNC